MARYPPGFRFHPTDEELVGYYLKKKTANKFIDGNAISDVDLYKWEPWDMPAKSPLTEGEWYFFSPRDRKYPNGARTNRATPRGYYKATGKDKTVHSGGCGKPIGLKKTLVYYIGRAPHGQRTDWVMHEYRLADSGLVGSEQNHYVLCRLFNKKGEAGDCGPSVVSCNAVGTTPPPTTSLVDEPEHYSEEEGNGPGSCIGGVKEVTRTSPDDYRGDAKSEVSQETPDDLALTHTATSDTMPATAVGVLEDWGEYPCGGYLDLEEAMLVDPEQPSSQCGIGSLLGTFDCQPAGNSGEVALNSLIEDNLNSAAMTHGDFNFGWTDSLPSEFLTSTSLEYLGSQPTGGGAASQGQTCVSHATEALAVPSAHGLPENEANDLLDDLLEVAPRGVAREEANQWLNVHMEAVPAVAEFAHGEDVLLLEGDPTGADGFDQADRGHAGQQWELLARGQGDLLGVDEVALGAEDFREGPSNGMMDMMDAGFAPHGALAAVVDPAAQLDHGQAAPLGRNGLRVRPRGVRVQQHGERAVYVEGLARRVRMAVRRVLREGGQAADVHNLDTPPLRAANEGGFAVNNALREPPPPWLTPPSSAAIPMAETPPPRRGNRGVEKHELDDVGDVCVKEEKPQLTGKEEVDAKTSVNMRSGEWGAAIEPPLHLACASVNMGAYFVTRLDPEPKVPAMFTGPSSVSFMREGAPPNYAGSSISCSRTPLQVPQAPLGRDFTNLLLSTDVGPNAKLGPSTSHSPSVSGTLLPSTQQHAALWGREQEISSSLESRLQHDDLGIGEGESGAAHPHAQDNASLAVPGDTHQSSCTAVAVERVEENAVPLQELQQHGGVLHDGRHVDGGIAAVRLGLSAAGAPLDGQQVGVVESQPGLGDLQGGARWVPGLGPEWAGMPEERLPLIPASIARAGEGEAVVPRRRVADPPPESISGLDIASSLPAQTTPKPSTAAALPFAETTPIVVEDDHSSSARVRLIPYTSCRTLDSDGHPIAATRHGPLPRRVQGVQAPMSRGIAFLVSVFGDTPGLPAMAAERGGRVIPLGACQLDASKTRADVQEKLPSSLEASSAIEDVEPSVASCCSTAARTLDEAADTASSHSVHMQAKDYCGPNTLGLTLPESASIMHPSPVDAPHVLHTQRLRGGTRSARQRGGGGEYLGWIGIFAALCSVLVGLASALKLATGLLL